MANIKFGTDGFRAIIAEDFTFENVRKIVTAIAHLVQEQYDDNTKILIGYDPRFLGKEFSQYTAELLANYGFNVLLSAEVIPTPVLAFCAKKYNACAIMFTASHNPYTYQGLKFIPPYGGPANSKITNRLMELMDKEFTSTNEPQSIITTSFNADYTEHLKTIIDYTTIQETLDKNGKKIIYDALHSAASHYLTSILDENKIKYEGHNLTHTPTFGGLSPEPSQKNLTDLAKLVTETPNAIGFSNDGDGDRFGVINENGEFVTPNEVLGILLLHLKKHKNYEGNYVKTIAASTMHDILASKLCIELYEVPVGFKHVAEAMMTHDIIIGGEESGGLSIKKHVPEKDGILAILLILEAICYAQKPLAILQNELKQFTGYNFINKRVDIQLDNFEIAKKIISNLETLEKVAQFKVIEKDLRDGIKLKLDDKLSWVLVRASGTEPLLRVYIESVSQQNIEQLEAAMKQLTSS